MFLSRGYLCQLPILNVYLARERFDDGDRDAAFRSCAPPSTICSARDICWGGAFQRRVFWWRHCWIAGPRLRGRSRGRINGSGGEATRVW